jgi:anti-sigma factor RsiW
MSAAMACREILANISAYLDGELDRTACDAIDQHCYRCPRCADLVHSLREMIGLCRQAAAELLPDPVRARARERVRRLLDASSEP